MAIETVWTSTREAESLSEATFELDFRRLAVTLSDACSSASRVIYWILALQVN